MNSQPWYTHILKKKVIHILGRVEEVDQSTLSLKDHPDIQSRIFGPGSEWHPKTTISEHPKNWAATKKEKKKKRTSGSANFAESNSNAANGGGRAQ
jgi:hypothetical protein